MWVHYYRESHTTNASDQNDDDSFSKLGFYTCSSFWKSRILQNRPHLIDDFHCDQMHCGRGDYVSVSVHDRLNSENSRDFPDISDARRTDINQLIGLRLI